MRVDPVLVLCAAAAAGSLVAVAPWPTLAAFAAIMLLIVGRVGMVAAFVAAVALGGSAWRAHHAIRAFDDTRVEARDALGGPQRCGLEGTIVASPVRRGGNVSYIVATTSIDCDEAPVPSGLRVRLYGGPEGLARGDRVAAIADLAPVQLFRNAELPDPMPRAARLGVAASGGALTVELLEPGSSLASKIDHARAHARTRIDSTFSPAAAPLARALVLGESDLAPEDDDAFRLSGLAHLLAVSGTHLVFAIVTLVKMLEALLVRAPSLAGRLEVRRLAALLGAPLALGYADFAGGSGSAWRAAWMLGIALGARALGRRPTVARSFAASLAIGSVVDPLVAFDLSYLLSAAATAGLVVLGGPLTRHLAPARPRWLGALVSTVTATVASMTACAPLLALLGPSLTLAGILANVLAAPLGEIVALPLCLLHPLLSPWPTLEHGVALVASLSLQAVSWIAHASAAATWSMVPVPPPGPWHFSVLAVGAVAALSTPFRRLGVLVAALSTILGWSIVERAAVQAGRPLGELRVTALDVGQGDATLVDLPDGTLMLIDGGGSAGSPIDPGRLVLMPILRARRRERVDVAVLTHPHPDHLNGLATLVSKTSVGELWDTGQGRVDGAGPLYRRMLQDLERRGIAVRGPRELCSRPRTYGSATVRVIGPCPDFTAGRGANDNSLVIHVKLGARAALLTGDAEAHQEAELVAEHGVALRADLLKVGHHGSRTSSTPAFMERVRPSVATISCGVRNDYGHPHAETLDTLARVGAAALRLDRTGSVTWATNGDATAVTAFSEPR